MTSAPDSPPKSLPELQSWLADSLADEQLSNAEKAELRELASSLDQEKLRFLRNRAFAFARDQLTRHDSIEPNQALATLRWLEQLVKVIDTARDEQTLVRSAHFSPGNACRNKLLDLCHGARHSIAICVFTIADDALTDGIIKAHTRGVSVKIITDNDKSADLGSDIEQLKNAGIPLVMDTSPYHMHHKFALFDDVWLASGSFNWTRSATTSNEENIIVINDLLLIREFQQQFDNLWQQFSR